MAKEAQAMCLTSSTSVRSCSALESQREAFLVPIPYSCLPRGGNGGRGGDVIFKADPNVISLTNVPRVARAMDGGKGRNRK